MREILELRNVIVHEYSIEDLLVTFERTEEFVRNTGTFKD
jgi:uncharacterized protein with HEPN domain